VKIAIGQDEFAVEVGVAVETILYKKPDLLPRSFDWVLGLIELRGEVVPVIDMASFNGQAAMEITPQTRLLIVRHEKLSFALVVSGVSPVSYVPSLLNDVEQAPQKPANYKIGFDKWVKLEGSKLNFLDLKNLVNEPGFLTLTY